MGVLIVLSLIKSFQASSKYKNIDKSEEGVQVQTFMLTNETRRQTVLSQIIAKGNALQRA